MQQTKDWTGNSKAIFATHGASNHSEEERADLDYYATDPEAVEKLLEVEEFFHYILEPACGGGHIAEVLLKHGHDVLCSDIVDRGYEHQALTTDFLKCGYVPRNSRDIITNPPYLAKQSATRQKIDYSRYFDDSIYDDLYLLTIKAVDLEQKSEENK